MSYPIWMFYKVFIVAAFCTVYFFGSGILIYQKDWRHYCDQERKIDIILVELLRRWFRIKILLWIVLGIWNFWHFTFDYLYQYCTCSCVYWKQIETRFIFHERKILHYYRLFISTMGGSGNKYRCWLRISG